MTVEQLIKALQGFPEEWSVIMEGCDCMNPAGEVMYATDFYSPESPYYHNPRQVIIKMEEE